MYVRVVTALLLIALATAAVASAATRNGGNSIANAPTLTVNHQVSGGGTMNDCWDRTNSGAEFWRIPLVAGTVLVVDYGSVNGQEVEVNILHPNETDYTLDQGNSVANGGTGGKDELRFRPNINGSWILVVSGSCEGDYGYQLSVSVQSHTQVTLRGPNAIRPNATGTLRGVVSGVDEGQVTLQDRSGGSWHTYSTTDINTGGVFTWQGTFTGRCRPRSTWTERAIFAGDDTHPAGISNTVVVRAACRS